MNIDLVEVWNTAGIANKGIFAFIVILSIYLVYLVVERALAYRNAQRESFAYVMALRDYLQKRRLDDALTAAKKYRNSHVAKVVESGLVAYKQGREAVSSHGPDEVGEFDVVESVNRALERVKEREVASLRRGLGGLATIASITPFIGLLGTVIGIIGAFAKLNGGGGMEVVGPAIAEALIATAVGLFVAIPAAIFFNIFTGKVENFSVDMNDVSSEFLDHILREGRVG